MEKFVLDGRLGEVTVPVDIVWGASDRVMPLSYAERMLAELPRARLTELPRCGHVPQQECPAAFAEALGKLLAGPPPEAAPEAVTAAPRRRSRAVIHADVLGERARLSPEKTALVFVPTGERFTYRELNARAERAAALLRDRLGLAKGDRVGLLAHNRVEYVDLFFAAAKTGIVLVPLGTRLTPHELAFIAGDAGLSALVYGGEFAETVAALRAESAIPLGIALDAPAAAAATSPGPPSSPRSPTAPFDEDPLRRRGPPRPPLHERHDRQAEGRHGPAPDDGLERLEHALCWGLRESDVSPVFTPLYHAGGLGAFLVPIFAAGGTIVLHAGFDPAEIWATVATERCTVVLGVPTIWKLLLEHPSFASADLSSIRWLISGGAPLPLYLIDAYQRRGVVFKQGYGLTEVGRELLRDVRRGVGREEGLDRPAAHDDRREARRRGRAARCRPARWASSACAGRTSRRATGGTPPPRPPRSTTTASSTPATSRARTTTASSRSPGGGRTCSSRAA